MIEAVKSFFVNGKLLKEWNVKTVTLAPKSSIATKVTNFRPISCCTVLYKVISNLLAERLSKVIWCLISHYQSRFVKGRNIKDNIKVAQDIVRKYGRSRISPRCAIRIDLHKAYASFHCDFLSQVRRVMKTSRQIYRLDYGMRDDPLILYKHQWKFGRILQRMKRGQTR